MMKQFYPSMTPIHGNHCGHPDEAYAGTSGYNKDGGGDDANYYFYLEHGWWRVCVRLSAEDGNYLSGSIDMYYRDWDVMRMFIPFLAKLNVNLYEGRCD